MDYTQNRLITAGEHSCNIFSQLSQNTQNSSVGLHKPLKKKSELPPMQNAPKLPTPVMKQNKFSTDLHQPGSEFIYNLPHSEVIPIKSRNFTICSENNNDQSNDENELQKQKIVVNQQDLVNFRKSTNRKGKKVQIGTSESSNREADSRIKHHEQLQQKLAYVQSKIIGIRQEDFRFRTLSNIDCTNLIDLSQSLQGSIPLGHFTQGTLTKYRNMLGVISKVQFNFDSQSPVLIRAQKTSQAVLASSSCYKFLSSTPQSISQIPQATIQSNYSGSSYNLYSYTSDLILSLDNSISQDMNCSPASILATIKYLSPPFLTLYKTRKLQVYIRHPIEGIALVNQFNQETKKPHDLEFLYNRYESNRGKIVKLVNKDPKWNSEKGKFMINFRGMRAVDSVHNFVLQQVDEGQNIQQEQTKQHRREVFIMTKTGKDSYKIRIGHPMSMTLGVGIVLSSLDFKWCCQ